MIRSALIAGVAAFVFIPAAQAEHDYTDGYYYSSQSSVKTPCERQKENDQLVGGLIGAVAGGVLGAAIADDDDDGYYYRSYHGHRGYGHHRARGHYGYYHHDDDSDQIAGAVIGGVLGAVVGSAIAGESTDCSRAPAWNDPYAPTRSPTGPAWEPLPTAPTQPVRVSRAPADEELVGGPRTVRVEPVEPPTQQCTMVQRQTRLPDGSIVREPVEVCQDAEGRWLMQLGEPDS